MRRWIIFFLVLFCFYLNSEDSNCFTIIVGNKATVDGSVLIAHNEDDGGKNFFVNVYKVPSYIQSSVKLKNGGVLRKITNTYSFLWFQIPDIDFGDSYLNEKGVVIVSNSCRSRENKAEITDGGIGFMLRRIMAERASTAREAVEIAGELVKKYGYYSSGRSYCITDSEEGWILHIVKGKHWIARRIPDNHVAVIANYYTIRNINFEDKQNFMGSLDIIDYAKRRGWYDPAKDGVFDFAKVYSDPDNFKSMRNILRQWRGTNLLSKKKFKINKRFPFSFKSKRQIKITDLFKVLRDHYEGTEYDLTDHYKNGSPNSTKNRTICTNTTQYSIVAKLRSNLPLEIANVAWVAFRRPDSNAYSPWYFSITSVPLGYSQGMMRNAIHSHFKKPKSFFKFDPMYAFWNFARLSEIVDQNYKKRVKFVGKEWDNFEDYTIKNLKKKEKEFKYLLKKNKNIALKIITNYIQNLEYKKWFLASELIENILKN